VRSPHSAITSRDGRVDAALAALGPGFEENSNQIAHLADEPSFAPIPRAPALLSRSSGQDSLVSN
jgi:hypothetical protein